MTFWHLYISHIKAMGKATIRPVADGGERSSMSRTISVPCAIGDTIYSIIGERVKGYVINELRIDKDEVYMVSDGMHFRESQIGTYYFYDEEIAKLAFEKKYGKKANGVRI